MIHRLHDANVKIELKMTYIIIPSTSSSTVVTNDTRASCIFLSFTLLKVLALLFYITFYHEKKNYLINKILDANKSYNPDTFVNVNKL